MIAKLPIIFGNLRLKLYCSSKPQLRAILLSHGGEKFLRLAAFDNQNPARWRQPWARLAAANIKMDLEYSNSTSNCPTPTPRSRGYQTPLIVKQTSSNLSGSWKEDDAQQAAILQECIIFKWILVISQQKYFLFVGTVKLEWIWNFNTFGNWISKNYLPVSTTLALEIVFGQF